jgi:hypothetical protein
MPITGYNVYRGTSSGGETLLVSLGNTTSYVDATTSSGTTYYYQITAVNSVGEGARSGELSATPAATPPTGTDVKIANKVGGTVGKAELGDSITFSFSRAMDPNSILSGWTGTSTRVVVRLADNGSNDMVQVWDAANTTRLALGQVLTGGDYGNNVNFGVTGTISTMVMSGSTITVTFGTASGTTSTHTDQKALLKWTPSASAKDLSGNAMSTSLVTESGTIHAQF